MVSLDMSGPPSHLFITDHTKLPKRRRIIGATKTVILERIQDEGDGCALKSSTVSPASLFEPLIDSLRKALGVFDCLVDVAASEAIANTSLSKKRLRGAGDDRKSGLRLDQFGVLIIDESHTVTPGFEQASQMAAAVELAPPSWNVCLSATLLGNRDVDWLAHMQEKRASIFMTPDYIQAMGELFEREMQSSPDIFDQKAPLAVLSEPETALSRQARTELSELISPFLARRQRRCIGEDEDRSKHSYARNLC